MPTTVGGAPVPVAGDPADVPADLVRLAQWLRPASPDAPRLVLLRLGNGSPTGVSPAADPTAGYRYRDLSTGGEWAPLADGSGWQQVNPTPTVSTVTGLQAQLTSLQQADSAEAAARGTGDSQSAAAAAAAQATANAAQPLSGKDTNGGYVGIDGSGDVHTPHDVYVGHALDVHGEVSVRAAGQAQQTLGADSTRRSILQRWRVKRATDAARVEFVWYADADGEVVSSGSAQAAFDLWAYPFSPSGQMQFLRMLSVRIDQAYTPGQTSAYVEVPWPLRENGQRVYSPNNLPPGFDAWTAWTPQITDDAASSIHIQPGGGGSYAATGRFVQIGRTVHLRMGFTAHSTAPNPNGGSQGVALTLPAGMIPVALGTGWEDWIGTAKFYLGSAVGNKIGKVSFITTASGLRALTVWIPRDSSGGFLSPMTYGDLQNVSDANAYITASFEVQ